MNAGRGRGIDHGAAFGDGHGKRLLNKHVLSVGGCGADVRGMKLMRGRDVDRLDLGVGTKFFDRAVGARAKILGEFFARFAPRIGGRDELDARVETEGRQHDGEGPAKAGDAEAYFARRGGAHQRSIVSLGLRARETQSMIWSCRSCSASTRSR